ncbi:Smg-4/UPF3 family-domain-containing protein [Pestalotiopsis sp. NC0098]|nr:Smg-4/UPF3 family-domain-containing protein [Pestalotiopsis sp. NC0098]
MASAARTQNGVTTGSNATGEGSRKSRAQPTGQKLMVRQLPPLITEEEVQTILGDEWKTGNGKIDWAQFHPGKVSKSAFKEPRPSMYALHVIKDEDVLVLKDLVLRTTWHDAKNSYTMLGFQVHAQNVSTRVPLAKHRVDPRQGTIDQDPEFQAFLHNLTQPKDSQPKDIENGDQLSSDELGKEGKVVSHLVRYIQEKKAAKAKEAAAAKTARHSRQESQSTKAKSGEDTKKKSKESKADKSDKENAKEKAKEPTPKILTKKAAAQSSTAEASKGTSSQTATTKAADEAIPKSRRANIAQAAKILQRDLGLSPGSAHRRARQNAAKSEGTPGAETSTATTSEKQVEEVKEPEAPKTAPPTGPKGQSNEGSRRSRNRGKGAASSTNTTETAKGKASEGTAKPTTGPIILLKKEASKKDDSASGAASSPSTPTATTSANSTSTNTAAPPTGPKAAGSKGNAGKSNNQPQQKKTGSQATSGAVRAFVKHANPSQGITEALLKQAMETFGSVTFVEIDKRKGFAYVDFGDAESLRKAISASPISIAQGTVQVLERKDKKPAAATGAASSTPAAQQSTPAEKAPADPQTPTAAATPASTDRPKRGNRGRGRRGGAASANSASATNTASSDNVPSANIPPVE